MKKKQYLLCSCLSTHAVCCAFESKNFSMYFHYFDFEYKINSLTKLSIPLSHRISMTLYLFSPLTVTTHALHLMSLWSNHHHRSSYSPLLLKCFTSSLEPASYINQNSLSKLFIPLAAIFIWTCQFNLLHTAVTFHHFFTVSLWAQNLPVQKILSSALVCFCLSDRSNGSRPFTGLTCCFSSISVFWLFLCAADKVGQLSGQLLGAR